MRKEFNYKIVNGKNIPEEHNRRIHNFLYALNNLLPLEKRLSDTEIEQIAIFLRERTKLKEGGGVMKCKTKGCNNEAMGNGIVICEECSKRLKEEMEREEEEMQRMYLRMVDMQADAGYLGHTF